MKEKAFVGFRTHGVAITRTPDSIHCFKTATVDNEFVCEYDVFSSEAEAIDFIITPLMSSPPNHDVITSPS